MTIEFCPFPSECVHDHLFVVNVHLSPEIKVSSGGAGHYASGPRGAKVCWTEIPLFLIYRGVNTGIEFKRVIRFDYEGDNPPSHEAMSERIRPVVNEMFLKWYECECGKLAEARKRVEDLVAHLSPAIAYAYEVEG